MKKQTDRNGCNLGHKVDFFKSESEGIKRIKIRAAYGAAVLPRGSYAERGHTALCACGDLQILQPMTQSEFHNFLKRHNACAPALEWADGKTLEEVWATCDRGDWLAWLCERAGVDRRTMVGIGGEFAALVEHLMLDERSRAVIPACRAYAKGEISDEELAKVAAPADAAVYAAYAAVAAAAAAAADAAARAAAAYAAAAYAAADADAADAAVAVAYDETQRRCADIVRARVNFEKISEGIKL